MAMYSCDNCNATQDHNKFGLCANCGAMALTTDGE